MAKNVEKFEDVVNETKAEIVEKKESFMNRAKRRISDAGTDVKLFVQRNKKKIAAGAGVAIGALGAAVIMDKLNIDPGNLFHRNGSDDYVGESDETFESGETETTEVTE